MLTVIHDFTLCDSEIRLTVDVQGDTVRLSWMTAPCGELTKLVMSRSEAFDVAESIRKSLVGREVANANHNYG